jgi:hypothetical protein
VFSFQRHSKFSRTVGGQIPTRWHAGRYGIPDSQFDSATALQSTEIASDKILSGKATVMLARGLDDLSEEALMILQI